MLRRLKNLFHRKRQLSQSERAAIFLAMSERLQRRLLGLPVEETIEQMIKQVREEHTHA